MALFRRLELLYLRKIEVECGVDGYVPEKFDTVIEKLNTLLDRVELKRHDQKGFQTSVRDSGKPSEPEDISSGESELVSLGIELLSFSSEAQPDKPNILFVDEPDVHLHLDLQDRLAKFIVQAFAEKQVTLVLATHSTALLAGLSEEGETSVSFMRSGDQDLSFKRVTDVDRAIMPIFGAHPLSNVFNRTPILLVEGEDDERIWQQAIRSSAGRIRVHPCVVGDIDRMAEYETEVRKVIESVYDNARGFSLRHRDQSAEEIEDLGPVIRMRLNCRASENLMLSDDALSGIGFKWQECQGLVQRWIDSNADHQYFEQVRASAENGFNRKEHDLKRIRNILIGLMTNKPWEVVVGQAIARLPVDGRGNDEGSLRDFLGGKVCQNLLGLDPI